MVNDALFKICENQDKNIKQGGHGDRMKNLCDKFNIEYKEEIIDKIVELRNKLFHEALWANTPPTSGADTNNYKYVRDLHGLNECLVPAILEYNNDYGKHNWFSMTNCPFNIAQ